MVWCVSGASSTRAVVYSRSCCAERLCAGMSMYLCKRKNKKKGLWLTVCLSQKCTLIYIQTEDLLSFCSSRFLTHSLFFTDFILSPSFTHLLLPCHPSPFHTHTHCRAELLNVALDSDGKAGPVTQRHPGSVWTRKRSTDQSIKPLSLVVLFPIAQYCCSLSFSPSFSSPSLLCRKCANIYSTKAARHSKWYWHASSPTLMHIQENWGLLCVCVCLSLGRLSMCPSAAGLGVDR